MKLTPCLIGLLALSGPVAAASPCVDVADNTERLLCYDRENGRSIQEAAVPERAERAEPSDKWSMSRRWELDAEDKEGTFRLKTHRSSYFLPAHWTDSPNSLPSSPNPANTVTRARTLNSVGAKFQLSLKTKLWEGIFGPYGDLWAGYTQQSMWQLYADSSPFRDTIYEPEVLAVFRTNVELGAGLRLRLLSFGVNHQSNGQSDPYSRSWNRLVGLVGIESEHFQLYARPWYAPKTGGNLEDNPDIRKYMGCGDLVGLWRLGDQRFSLTLRGPVPTSDRGAVLADWRFPIHRNLKGYLQVFSGYGETLLDYNHRQTSVGAGIAIIDW